MTKTQWSKVKAGDTVTCPTTGQPEKVKWNRSGGPGRRSVRTENHDHNRPSNEMVEMSR